MAESKDLEGMKKMVAVRVREIRLVPLSEEPLKLVMEVSYEVVSDDGDALYSDRLAEDVSDRPNIENKKFSDLHDLATVLAKKAAKKRWGKKN